MTQNKQALDALDRLCYVAFGPSAKCSEDAHELKAIIRTALTKELVNKMLLEALKAIAYPSAESTVTDFIEVAKQAIAEAEETK